MFIGMFLCLIWHGINVAFAAYKKKKEDETTKGLVNAEKAEAGYGTTPATPTEPEKPKLHGILVCEMPTLNFVDGFLWLSVSGHWLLLPQLPVT